MEASALQRHIIVCYKNYIFLISRSSGQGLTVPNLQGRKSNKLTYSIFEVYFLPSKKKDPSSTEIDKFSFLFEWAPVAMAEGSKLGLEPDVWCARGAGSRVRLPVSHGTQGRSCVDP